MKAGWKPQWETENRKPDFITEGGPPESVQSYGAKKFLWGNVPALDILKCKQNEGEDLPEDLRLLFAGRPPFYLIFSPPLTGEPKLLEISETLCRH
jgi:hypothetical protein